jgi:hypothetical protein
VRRGRLVVDGLVTNARSAVATIIGLDVVDRAVREMLIRDYEYLAPEIIAYLDIREIFADSLDDDYLDDLENEAAA